MLHPKLLARYLLPPAPGLLALATIEIPPPIIEVIANKEVINIEVVNPTREITRSLYSRKDRIEIEVEQKDNY